MRENGRASLRRKIIAGAVGFLLLGLVLTTIFGKKGLLEITRARKDYAALLREIETLKQEKIRLEREIAELKANPKAVERDAREKLWLGRPEEKVIIHK
jgi:cell division protein FtsB